MKLSSSAEDVIVTHALGSCLGITAYDSIAHVGGMMHVMMPLSNINPEKAQQNPYMFVDTGVPEFFKRIFAAGGVRNRLTVKVAGGAEIQRVGTEDRFAVGKRNYLVLKKILWKNDILIASEDVGGSVARTMYLHLDSGKVSLATAGQSAEL